MIRLSCFVFVLFQCFFSGQVFSQADGWKFVRERSGVKVYYRTVANSSIKEVKMETVFDEKLDKIVEVLSDVKGYAKWAYGVKSSEKLATLDGGEVVYYNTVKFPWPLKNRDIVIKNKMKYKDENTVVSTSTAAPDFISKKGEYVRIGHFRSQWIYEQRNGKVYGEYIFHSDPGGAIPAWLVNMALDEGPISTIKNLKKYLKEQK